MKKAEYLELAGTSYYARVYPTHMANDGELRQMFHPGSIVRYYLETIDLIEGVGVLVGVISLDAINPEIMPIPLAKLRFSERQFAEILDCYPEVYTYYRGMIAEILGIGTKQLTAAQIHKQLRACAMSAQTAFVAEEFYEDDPH